MQPCLQTLLVIKPSCRDRERGSQGEGDVGRKAGAPRELAKCLLDQVPNTCKSLPTFARFSRTWSQGAPSALGASRVLAGPHPSLSLQHYLPNLPASTCERRRKRNCTKSFLAFWVSQDDLQSFSGLKSQPPGCELSVGVFTCSGCCKTTRLASSDNRNTEIHFLTELGPGSLRAGREQAVSWSPSCWLADVCLLLRPQVALPLWARYPGTSHLLLGPNPMDSSSPSFDLVLT